MKVQEIAAARTRATLTSQKKHRATKLDAAQVQPNAAQRSVLDTLFNELAAIHFDLEAEIYELAHDVHQLDRTTGNETTEQREKRIDAHRQSAVHHTMVAFMRCSELRTVIESYERDARDAAAKEGAA